MNRRRVSDWARRLGRETELAKENGQAVECKLVDI